MLCSYEKNLRRQHNMPLYDRHETPHRVDIYLPDAPTLDSGGGDKLNWPASPSQAAVHCLCSTFGSSTVRRQDREGNTTTHRVAFLTEELEVTLIAGTKFVTSATDPDPGKTFLITGLTTPGRPAGHAIQDIPAFTYVICEELK